MTQINIRSSSLDASVKKAVQYGYLTLESKKTLRTFRINVTFRIEARPIKTQISTL